MFLVKEFSTKKYTKLCKLIFFFILTFKVVIFCLYFFLGKINKLKLKIRYGFDVKLTLKGVNVEWELNLVKNRSRVPLNRCWYRDSGCYSEPNTRLESLDSSDGKCELSHRLCDMQAKLDLLSLETTKLVSEWTPPNKGELRKPQILWFFLYIHQCIVWKSFDISILKILKAE